MSHKLKLIFILVGMFARCGGCPRLISVSITVSITNHHPFRVSNFFFCFFFERQIWITDGPLEYHRVTRGTTRSYPSPLGIMPQQFRRKPNKHGKNPLLGIEPRTY
ncbi:hypothetical protein Hanom_Chr15g01387391 [Helianthus anomalus]